MRLRAIPGLSSSLSSDSPTSTYWCCYYYLKKKHKYSSFWPPDRQNRTLCYPPGYWSCSKFSQSLLKLHCSIVKFLAAPLTPPGNHIAHGCFFALPSHSHLCLDEETGEILTAFIIISTVEDLTWAFSPLMAASMLTRIWGVCLFGKPGWAWPASPDVWGIGLQISFPQETILYLKLFEQKSFLSFGYFLLLKGP